MQHHKKNNKVEGAVPCGNPKRYGSREVVHMSSSGPQDRKRKINQEDDAVVTESQKHLLHVLGQQTKTDITLSEQYSQHRTFSAATSHDPGVDKLHGVHSFKKFKEVNDLDSRIDTLRHYGLDDEEITLKLTHDFATEKDITITSHGYGADPQSQKKKLQEIERKIQEKESALQTQETFRGALELGRRELEIERSLVQKQGAESSLLAIVPIQKKRDTTHPDDPINHISDILGEIDGKKERESRRDRRRRRKLARKKMYYDALVDNSCKDNPKLEEDEDLSDEIEDVQLDCGNVETENPVLSAASQDPRAILSLCDSDQVSNGLVRCQKGSVPSCHHPLNKETLSPPPDMVKQITDSKLDTGELKPSVKTIATNVKFLSDQEIISNRLSLQEILAIQKFQNYTEGEPNNVVYVKNMPAQTTEEDLVAVFGSFQSEHERKLEFKLLSGRMKGQAFITFPDEITASKAVKLINGYKLKGKPIILSFGKNRNS